MNFLRASSSDFEVNSKPKKPKSRESLIGNIVRTTVYLLLALAAVILVILVGFIILKSIPVFENTTLIDFLFTTKWDPENKVFGIGMIIIMTLVMLAIAMLIAIPITLFATLFISEYLNPKQQKAVMTIVKLLAGVPSVVFGLFARDQIGWFYRQLGAPSNDNLMVAATTMAFMAIPTMVSLSYNAVRSVPEGYRMAALGLGISKEKTTFRTVRRSVMPEIISAVIMGMARVIGETMAIMMIAGNSTGGLNTSDGLGGFLFSSIRTLASTIGLEMLENKGPEHEAALYAIGLFLFVLVFVINISILVISNIGRWKSKAKIRREVKYHKIAKIEEQQINDESFDSSNIVEKNKPKIVYTNNQLAAMVNNKASNKFFKQLYSGTMLTCMVVSTSVLILFTFWILGDILVQGFAGMQHIDAFVSIDGQDGIFAALLTTILLILATLIFAIPIALGTAIYLNEYGYKGSWLVKSFRFSINLLASTPSIIFGIFGLSIFVKAMGLSFSVLAAALTMTIVILPMLINNFENSLLAVPQSLREAGAAVGMSRVKRLFVIVLPNAMEGIVTGIILSMARIIGESAPVYLTLGTAIRMPAEGFMSQGATLTTGIYMLASEAGPGKGESIAYLMSMVTIVFVLSLNFASGKISSALVGNKGIVKKVRFSSFKNIIISIQEFSFRNWWSLTASKFKKIGKKIVRALQPARMVRTFKLWYWRKQDYRKIKRGKQ